MAEQDRVSGFSYDLSTVDGCRLGCRYQVHQGQVREISNEGWKPMAPAGIVTGATLTTHYLSGRRLAVELDGDEHVALQEAGRFDRMLESISRGNMPGEALKRQLTKAYDLPRLPKLKRPKPG